MGIYKTKTSGILAFIALASGALAQQPSARTGVIIVAHGGGSDWNAAVAAVAADVRRTIPAEVALLMGPEAPRFRFQDQVAKLARAGVDSIVVVPLLVSSHSGHYEQIRWLARQTDSLNAVMQHHLHMAGIERPSAAVALSVARALDDAPELSEVLAERARQLAGNATGRALLLVGHGPNSAEDYASWMQNLRRVADRVRESTGFADVRVELVRDDAPAAVRAEAVTRTRELVALQARLTGNDVVVVPILIGRSSVGDERFRRDLAGLPIVYSGTPILPHPAISRWVVSRVQVTMAAPARWP
jgi:sirohydrochlorin ferrochelatase